MADSPFPFLDDGRACVLTFAPCRPVCKCRKVLDGLFWRKSLLDRNEFARPESFGALQARKLWLPSRSVHTFPLESRPLELARQERRLCACAMRTELAKLYF